MRCCSTVGDVCDDELARVVGRTRSFFSALPVFDARVFEAGAGDAVGVAGGDKLATFTRCCADIFESNSNVGAYVKKKRIRIHI